MRKGQNPAKFTQKVSQANPVTVAVITFIPFLGGYYRQSLEVLKVCLGSILAHTDAPFDLLVFDNASCSEVVTLLQELHATGKIQILILSDRNMGKVGAWNFIFGAAPGQYVAYSDSDVYYYPGWLAKHLDVFEAFPEAGTVAGLPRRGRRTFSTNTLQLAEQLPGVSIEEGHFIPDEWIIEHARSLGKLDQVQEDLGKSDFRLTRGGVSAYATATHFQFMVRAETVRPFLPFPYDRPMGASVANFDRAINTANLLRLAVTQRVVRHLGNSLDEQTLAEIPTNLLDPLSLISPAKPGGQGAFLEWKPLKRLLLGLHDRIFQLYFNRKV